MDPGKGKPKKGLISKTWERCKSLSLRKSSPLHKSKSWPRGLSGRVAPEGCFSIYVGPERERFIIKTEFVNHPLFKTLLEQAESEYGYSSDGPLLLPCEVHDFLETVAEMEERSGPGCRSFVGRSHSFYHLLTPPRSSSNICITTGEKQRY